ncbi:MAG: DMT family transporter [Bacteroidales bacterium]|nr:DMT family transporter [Bacteroidales bacterium]
MEQTGTSESLIKLHLSVLIAGTTGLYGRLIELGGLALSCYRMALAALVLWVAFALTRRLERVKALDVWRLFVVGGALGVHWALFYASIKASNISIGVVCFTLVGFFTAFLEPWLTHGRISAREILVSGLTLVGVSLIFHLDTRYRTGILLGVASSLFGAIYTVSNKRLNGKTDYDSRTMVLYEMTGGTIVLGILTAAYGAAFGSERLLPTWGDMGWLGVCAVCSTIFLYLLQIQALKGVSAFTVNLTNNLEPIYSIVLAMVFFDEANELNATFACGLGLILLSVGIQTWSVVASARKARRKARYNIS